MAAAAEASIIAKVQEEMYNRVAVEALHQKKMGKMEVTQLHINQNIAALDKKLDSAFEMLSLQLTKAFERLEFSNRDKLILDPRPTRTRAESANTNPYWFHFPWFEGNQYSGEIQSHSLLNSVGETPMKLIEDGVLVETEHAQVFDKMSELHIDEEFAENGVHMTANDELMFSDELIMEVEMKNEKEGCMRQLATEYDIVEDEDVLVFDEVPMMNYETGNVSEFSIRKELIKIDELDEFSEEFGLDEFTEKFENDKEKLFELSNEENEILQLPIEGGLDSPKIEFPMFDGSNPKEWIFKCMWYFQWVTRISDKHKVSLALSHFEGRAASWFEFNSEMIRGWSWKQFVGLVCCRFGNLKEVKVLKEFSTLEVEGPLEEYGEKFEQFKSLMLMMNSRSYEANYSPGKLASDSSREDTQMVFPIEARAVTKALVSSNLTHTLVPPQWLLSEQFLLTHLQGFLPHTLPVQEYPIFELNDTTTAQPKWISVVLTSYDKDQKNIKILRSKSVNSRSYSDYSSVGGIIKVKGRVYMGNGSDLRLRIIQNLHDSTFGCFLGMKVTYQMIRRLSHLSSLRSEFTNFEFIDPPPPESLLQILELLIALSALIKHGELTKVDRRMAEFPLDPMLSQVMVASNNFQCFDGILSIVALLSICNSILYRPQDKQVHAHNNLGSFYMGNVGEHIAWLRVYSSSQETYFSIQWCLENHLLVKGTRRVREISYQLEGILEMVAVGSNRIERQKVNFLVLVVIQEFQPPGLTTCLRDGVMAADFKFIKDSITTWKVRYDFAAMNFCDPWGQGSLSGGSNVMTRSNGWLGTKRRDQWLIWEEECFAIVAVTGAEVFQLKKTGLGLLVKLAWRWTKNKWAGFYIKELGWNAKWAHIN